jgi:hypothetical protein
MKKQLPPIVESSEQISALETSSYLTSLTTFVGALAVEGFENVDRLTNTPAEKLLIAVSAVAFAVGAAKTIGRAN